MCSFYDCGDTLHGTYPVLKTQGHALVPVINLLGLDAMTAHWEFAYGLATFKMRAAELSYPMLAINVYDQARKERFFPPYSLKKIGGLRIGIVGIASNIIDKNMPPSFSEGLEFTLGNEELQPTRYYPTTFITEQGVAAKYGRNRQHHTERSVEALRSYLAKHHPLREELRGTFVAV